MLGDIKEAVIAVRLVLQLEQVPCLPQGRVREKRDLPIA
jgi:hypothetical protein